MSQLRTIILAAGKGTRMKSATPKVLHHACGVSLIQYVLNAAKSVGSLKTCVVVGHQSEKVRAFLGREIATVIQKKLRGTADAVRCCAAFLRGYRGDVLILCGDTPLLKKETIQKLLAQHRRSKAAATFLTALVPDPHGYGRVVRDMDGKVTAIREENDAADAEKQINEINVGVYCFRNDVLQSVLKAVKINPRKKEFYLTTVIELLAARKLKIATTQTDEPQEGFGVNDREDLAAVSAVLRRQVLSGLMKDGVTIVDPSTTIVSADAKIGADTIIQPFTVIEENVQIGSGCVIGPFARIRPGTRIAHQAQVGNFAEVSRSTMGPKTLMKHFGFLGDAQVGAGVNIGAGTVTANYDGKNKNKTKILDHAFIGSDSVLVAPVWVGKKAVTGAGCVVTRGKRIPDNAVVVGVPGRIINKK